MLKTLLAREEVNPNKPDNTGRTPLSHAAGNENEYVVKLLLGQEINLDQPDNKGRTPLSHAAGGDVRKWWKYNSGKERSTLRSQITVVEYRPRMPQELGVRRSQGSI